MFPGRHLLSRDTADCQRSNELHTEWYVIWLADKQASEHKQGCMPPLDWTTFRTYAYMQRCELITFLCYPRLFSRTSKACAIPWAGSERCHPGGTHANVDGRGEHLAAAGRLRQGYKGNIKLDSKNS